MCVTKSLKCLLDVWPSSLLPRPSLSSILTGVCDQVPSSLLLDVWPSPSFKTFSIFDLDRCVWPSSLKSPLDVWPSPSFKTFSIFDLDRCVWPSPSSASLMCDQVPSFQDLLYLRSWQVCVTKSLKCLLDVWPSSLLPRPSLSSILTGVCDQVPQVPPWCVTKFPPSKTFSIFDLDRCVWPSSLKSPPWCVTKSLLQDLLYLRSWQVCVTKSLKCLLDVWPSSLLPRPSLSSILTGVCDQVPQVPPWCVTKFPPSKTFSIFDLDRCLPTKLTRIRSLCGSCQVSEKTAAMSVTTARCLTATTGANP